MGDIKISCKGNNGEFIVYEDTVEIRRRTALGNIDAAMYKANSGIGSERIIRIDDLEGIEFVPAVSIWKNGYMTLVVKGELRNNNGLKGAAKHPATIIFWTKMNDEFKAVADYLLKEIDKRKTQKVEVVNNSSNNSIVDELQKLKELYDSGILSEEEFSVAKQRILNKQ